MNLLRRNCLFKRLFKSFEKYSLSSCSAVQEHVSFRSDKRLQTRLMNFLERSEIIDKNVNGFSNDIPNFPSLASDNNLQNNSSRANLEIETLIISIRKLQQSKQNQNSNSKISLNIIDDECCKILSKLSHCEVLQLLHLLTRIRPQEIPFLKFYKYSLLALRKSLKKKELTTQEALQLLFFEGLRKKSALHNVKFVIDFLPPMSNLSFMEQCVVAHTAFKCGVKLKEIKLLEEVIEKNAEMLVNDPALLVTFCKALRHAGPSNDCSLENLREAIINNDEKFTLKGAAHILSLFAEAKLQYVEVSQRFFDDSMKNLIEERIGREKLAEPAEKDVDRLLWASNIVNYELRSSDTLEISSFIHRRYQRLAKKPFLLANTLLSLWILNFRHKEIVIKCLEEKVFLPIVNEDKLWKPVARFQLLLSCVKIEAPEIELPKEIVKPYKVGMKIRGNVKKLQIMIVGLKEAFEITEAVIDAPVDGIYIPGVSFRIGEKKFHVDLLDETNCLKTKNVPHGLMNLKLRLLSQIGFHSILITEEQLNDAELFPLLIESCIKSNYQ